MSSDESNGNGSSKSFLSVLTIIFIIAVVILFFAFLSLKATIYGNTLNSFEVDQLCNVNDTVLQKVNGSWECSQPGYTGTCASPYIIVSGIVIGCVE